MKVATLCYVRDGSGATARTLMLHRIKKTNDMHAGKWNGLGGKLEPGETPEECAIREVREESGLEMIDPILRGIITFPQFSRGEDWVAYVFVAHRFRGALIDSAEGVLAWVDNDKLFDLPLWPGDRVFMRWLDDPRFFSAKFVYISGELTNYEVVFYTQRYTQDGAVETHVERERAAFVAVTTRNEVDTVAPDAPLKFRPVYRPEDDTYCWMCGGEVDKRHCKIICLSCGFTRDCSDP